MNDDDIVLSAALEKQKQRLPRLEEGVVLAPAFIMLYLRGPVYKAINGMDEDLEKLSERVATLEKLVVKLGDKKARSGASRKVGKEPAKQ